MVLQCYGDLSFSTFKSNAYCLLPTAYCLLKSEPPRNTPHFTLTNPARRTYAHILAFRLEAAEQSLDQMDEGNMFRPLFAEYIAFARIMANGNEEDNEVYQEKAEGFIDQLEDSELDDPFRLYAISEIELHRSVAHGRFGNRWAAGRALLRAHKRAKENLEKHPAFRMQFKSLGLMHASMGALPVSEGLRSVLSFLTGIDADIQKGLDESEQALEWTRENYPLFADEVRLLRIYIHLQILGETDKAFEIAETLELKPEESLIATYVLAQLTLKARNNGRALMLLDERPSGSNYPDVPVLDYLQGKANLYALNEGASKHLIHFLEHHKGPHLIKESNWMLAMWAHVNGRKEEAEKYRQMTIERGGEEASSDQWALHEAERGYFLPRALLRARLLFDGGYYDRAHQELLVHQHLITVREPARTEFHYRMGRIAQETGRTGEALDHYHKTVEFGADLPEYFACSAALYMGRLYEEMNAREKAAESFELCLQIHPAAFGTYLHSRAKLALENY